MTAKRRGFLVAAALAAGLALAEEGRAQTQLPGGFTLEGSAEAGVRGFIDKPPPEQLGKFEEYRDFNNGLFLPDLRLRLFTPDEKYSFDFAGREWGLTDQEYYVGGERLGLFRFDFGWNQIPHILSTSARLLAAQPEPGVFVLSLPRPPLTAYNSAPRLDKVGFQTDIANILFKLTPTPEIDLIGEYTRMWKHGDRPFSMVFGSPGSNFFEVLQPINSYTHDVRLRATLAKPDYQLQFDYGFSLYENSFTAVRADNPCFGNLAFCSSGDANPPAPATGQASLPPDNFANTFGLSGGVNVPWWRTRLTGNVTYSWWHQNQAFLPQTINPALASVPEVQLPQSSLNGNVQIFLVNMGVVSRPLRQLTLTGKYRFYSYNDWSDEPTFPELVQNDKSLLEGRQAKRLDYNRQDASLDGRWRFNEAVALTVGGGWEQWNRSSGREVPQTNEVSGKVALDVVPYDWLNGRISYKPAFRRATEYNTGARESTVVLEDDPATTAQSPLLRKYDEADRNLQQINLMATATPFGRYSPLLETLSVSPNFTWRWADYPNSPLGLQKAEGWSVGIDAAWKPQERFSVFAGYIHEDNNSRQISRSRPVSDGVTLDFTDFNWVTEIPERIDTAYAGFQVGLIPSVLDWSTNFAFSNAVSHMNNSNPVPPTSGSSSLNATATAQPFPAIKNQLAQMTTQLRYHFWKKWSASVFYMFEQFRQDNWQTETIEPFTPGVTSIWLGHTSSDYTVHIVGGTLGYRF